MISDQLDSEEEPRTPDVADDAKPFLQPGEVCRAVVTVEVLRSGEKGRGNLEWAKGDGESGCSRRGEPRR